MKLLITNFFSALTFSILLIPPALSIWKLKGPKERNFYGKLIPVGAGILLLLPVILTEIFRGLETEVILVLLIGLVGLVDDIYDKGKIKGLKGHFRFFLKRKRVTGGILKTVVGGLVSLLAVLTLNEGILYSLIHFFVIILFINALNLFDLRPGRCLKVYFFLVVTITAGNIYYGGNIEIDYVYALTAAAAVFFLYDLAGRAMLGDAGSNMLGFSIGLSAVHVLPVRYEAVCLLFLALLHLFAEKYSLSELIAKNHILYYLDRLGRPGENDN